MNSRNNKIKYIPGLDGLRGMAILLVMLFHTAIPFFKGGFIGVDIFFVLSGFLITSLLLSELSLTGRINLKYFYMRRILRLLPALVLMLIIVPLAANLLDIKGSSYTDTLSSLITLFYSANWARAFNLHPMGLLSHTWSLSIEEQFYMLWPIGLIMLIKYVRSERKIFNIVVLLSIFSWLLRIYLTYSGHTADRIYNGLDTRADALLIGCSAALIGNTGLLEKRISKSILPAYAGSTLPLLILFTISWRNVNMFYWINFLVEILTAALILHVAKGEKSLIKKIFTLKPLVWIGSISYGLYLWHDPVFGIMLSFGFSKLSILGLGSIITFAIASASYYIMEKPILKFKSRLQANPAEIIASKPAVAAASMIVEE